MQFFLSYCNLKCYDFVSAVSLFCNHDQIWFFLTQLKSENCIILRRCLILEVESFRTSLASRTPSRTHIEVLGPEGQVLGLSLEASRPQKFPCPRHEDSTIFLNRRTFADRLKKCFVDFFVLDNT